MTREFSQIGTQWEKNSGFVQQVQSRPSFSSGGKISERGERGMGQKERGVGEGGGDVEGGRGCCARCPR